MTIHTGEVKYACTICPKGFTGAGSLKKHMTVHTVGRNMLVPIDPRFIQVGHLKGNMTIHAEKLCVGTISLELFIGRTCNNGLVCYGSQTPHNSH